MKIGGNNGRYIIAKPGKYQNDWIEGKLQVLENIGSGHHQTSRDERKNKEYL